MIELVRDQDGFEHYVVTESDGTRYSLCDRPEVEHPGTPCRHYVDPIESGTCPNDGTPVTRDGDYCAACNVSAQASDLFFKLHHGMGDAQAIVAALRAMGQWQEWCPVCGYESDVDGMCEECRTYRVTLDKAPRNDAYDFDPEYGIDRVTALVAQSPDYNADQTDYVMTPLRRNDLRWLAEIFWLDRMVSYEIEHADAIALERKDKTMGYFSNEMVAIVDGIVNAIIDDGGATIDIETGQVMTLPDGGYVVAIGAPYEWIIESPHNDFNHRVIDAIQQYFNHAELWANDLHAATPIHMGVWADDGRLYLDLVQVTTDIDIAMQAARERKQLAIFDTTTGQDIVVPPLVVTLRKTSDPIITAAPTLIFTD
jgi:hypothetical protein